MIWIRAALTTGDRGTSDLHQLCVARVDASILVIVRVTIDCVCVLRLCVSQMLEHTQDWRPCTETI